MKTIIESNENYSVIDLTLEYENWTGTERYAVISDLDQGYIEEMFASELSEYKPYIYMANAFLDIRRDFRNNNKKYEMRSIRSESVFSFEDSDTETHHKEISIPDFVEQWIENYELKEAIKKLTDKERERLFEYFYKDKTCGFERIEEIPRFQDRKEKRFNCSRRTTILELLEKQSNVFSLVSNFCSNAWHRYESW